MVAGVPTTSPCGAHHWTPKPAFCGLSQAVVFQGVLTSISHNSSYSSIPGFGVPCRSPAAPGCGHPLQATAAAHGWACRLPPPAGRAPTATARAGEPESPRGPFGGRGAGGHDVVCPLSISDGVGARSSTTANVMVLPGTTAANDTGDARLLGRRSGDSAFAFIFVFSFSF